MITISIVKHNHGKITNELINQLIKLKEITKIIVTINTPDNDILINHKKIIYIKNKNSKGFSQNHNLAFLETQTKYYCVMNPDIKLEGNPFPFLLEIIEESNVGVVGPMIKNIDGQFTDCARKFITPSELFWRRFYRRKKTEFDNLNKKALKVDWIGGMFMLFKSDIYKKIKGFDENYFLYVEDCDICRRLKEEKLNTILCTNVSIIHEAQRNTFKNLRHLLWHIESIIRYFIKFNFK